MKAKKIIQLIVLVLTVLTVTFSACKKKEETGISSGGCPNVSGGVDGNIGKKVMFWISKDYGCGTLKLISLTYKSNNKSVSYSLQSNTSTINKFHSAQPVYGAEGTTCIVIDKGFGYNYRFQCDGRTFSGEFYAECGNEAQAIEVK